MEIGNQIKKYRTELKLSQDNLAEKVYVTRQTISNWENNRNYPDIRSLVLLSNIFGVSLDILVKGDLEQMKDEIREDEIIRFRKNSQVYAVFLIGMVVLPMPLIRYLKVWGIIIWLFWSAAAIACSWKIEKFKNAYDIHTYKEIVAFMDGERLDELEKNQEIGKRPYQIALLVTLTAAVGLVVVLFLRRAYFHF